MFKKLWDKRKDKRGFTLVELIVVLIILAILAALLIPALTGYIKKAQEKQVIAETRQAVMAAQTLADEDYAAGITLDATSVWDGTNKEMSVTNSTVSNANIQDLADVKGDVTGITFTTGNEIATLQYTSKGGKVCDYTANPGAGVDMYDVN